MAAPLSESDNVSIATISLYVPALCVALFLSYRHGLGYNSGWFFLIMFSLIRITGAILQLETRSHPLDVGLYTGSAILSVIGLSPLILVNLSLLGRSLDSIYRDVVRGRLATHGLRLVQLIVVAGLVLGAVGGYQAGNKFSSTGVYTVPSIAKVGLALMIAGYATLLAVDVFVVSRLSRCEKGEKRLALAVSLAMPLVLVRLVYASLSTFGHDGRFNQLTGDVNVHLAMAVVMEMLAVAVVESIGLTFQPKPTAESREASREASERDEPKPDRADYPSERDESGAYV
jgi:hypothetical protein